MWVGRVVVERYMAYLSICWPQPEEVEVDVEEAAEVEEDCAVAKLNRARRERVEARMFVGYAVVWIDVCCLHRRFRVGYVYVRLREVYLCNDSMVKNDRQIDREGLFGTRQSKRSKQKESSARDAGSSDGMIVLCSTTHFPSSTRVDAYQKCNLPYSDALGRKRGCDWWVYGGIR